MKKYWLTAFSAILFCIAASAQVKKAVQTVKISTPTVNCDLCKDRIESYLKRYEGITYINVNVKKQETTVKYVTDRTNVENIKTAITNAGYDADELTANPDSYKRLPITCKKPEDGGPAPKKKN